MRLLLTNDDGYDQPGLNSLAKALSNKHEVWIVAPDKNRSAVSHGITMSSPLKISRYKERHFICSGVPVDCVINGLAVMPEPPDVVLSGINTGANIGTDILYSGTCAAARQASLNGIPGIAVSVESHDGVWHYDALSSFVCDNIHSLVSLCDKNIFVNINALALDSYKGWRLTRLSHRYYGDSVQLYVAPDGHSYSFFRGGDIRTEGGSDCDFAVVEDGFISISRVHAQPVSADDIKEADLDLLL